MFNSLLFSSAAQTEMKRWRVAEAGLSGLFIRHYNLRFLRGRGQRWLLFAPYFMGREDNRPTQSPSVSHGRSCLACEAAQPRNEGQTRIVRNKVTRGDRKQPFPFFFCPTVKSDLTVCRFVGRACDNLMSFQGRGDQ